MTCDHTHQCPIKEADILRFANTAWICGNHAMFPGDRWTMFRLLESLAAKHGFMVKTWIAYKN
jgi:hypothetical protein